MITTKRFLMHGDEGLEVKSFRETLTKPTWPRLVARLEHVRERRQC